MDTGTLSRCGAHAAHTGPVLKIPLKQASETFPFADKAEFIAARAAGHVLTVVLGKEGKMAAVAEIEAFLHHGPVVGLALAHLLPDPQNRESNQPEENVNVKNMKF